MLFFIDTPWTEALQTQAEDRIHRFGSKNQYLFIG